MADRSSNSYFSPCPRYVEELLVSEIRAIAPDSEPRATTGGVSFVGTRETGLRICLWTRLADRVLLELERDRVAGRDDLYALARHVPWERHFSVDETIAVFGHSAHSAFRHSGLPFLVVKDAVCDRFRARTGRRPSVDANEPDIRISLYLTDRQAIVYLDLSGESLHRRGYRTESVAAPLRENTAAAVLTRSGWPAALQRWRAEGGRPPLLVDPMCGSGTFAIEAALMATDSAPGLDRSHFGFQRWSGYDGALGDTLLEEARERRRGGIDRWKDACGRIWASDSDPDAIAAAQANAERAGVSPCIDFGQRDFAALKRGALLGMWNEVVDGANDVVGALDSAEETTDAEARGPELFVVTNPPYGIRMDSGRIYAELGTWLARTLTGFSATVLAASRDHLRQLGLQAQRVLTFYNGGTEIVAGIVHLNETNRYREPTASRGKPPRTERSVAGNDSEGSNAVVNRFKKNRRKLRPLLRSEEIGCYRLYDADIPQYAAAIDVYTAESGAVVAVLQEYAPPSEIAPEIAARRLEELRSAVREYLKLDDERVIVKQRRRQRGADQYEAGRRSVARSIIVRERGMRFEVRPAGYIDTGLFCEKRDLRAMIRSRAAGCRFLNLFAYTCTASVAAALGGASATVSVDTSRTYLEWGRRNFQLNRLDDRTNRLVNDDSIRYLESATERFDLILVDPPTFSNSKSRDRDFEVQRDHGRLISLAAARLTPGGAILFANNYRRFRIDPELAESMAVEDVSDSLLPPDFARSRKRNHLFVIRRRS